MILLKPVFVNHGGDPIFCVDLHPQGMKFVTGGLYEGSGRIIIWNLFPVVERDAEAKETIPRKLYDIQFADCVYCVRWSNSGHFLAGAGGGDDVQVFRKEGEKDGQKLFETEVWACARVLKGHVGGVFDMSWASQDAWLATAGSDKFIIVWNVDKAEIVARLEGHNGRVKGVAWDPVGMYLASQADDQTCRIWRTSDWKQQIQISEPFQESRNKIHFLRLSWSPDGQFLVTANAKNSGEPTARIIEINGRPIKEEGESWSCEMDFVGHHKEVTCVRFNNALFKKPGVKTKHCVLATGSRDNTVAVWSTVQRGPIVVVRNLFTKAVVDLAWGPNGLLLIACSADGSIGVMVFKELGQVVSVEDQVSTLEAMYGNSYTTQYINQSKIISVESKLDKSDVDERKILETKPSLEVQEPATKMEASKSPIHDSSSVLSTAGTMNIQVSEPSKVQSPSLPLVGSDESPVCAKQIETRRPDGKRRIVPIMLSSTSLGTQSFSSSSDSKTKIMIERREIVPTVEQIDAENSLKRKELVLSPIPAKKVKQDLIPFELPKNTDDVPEKVKLKHHPRPTEPILCPLNIKDSEIVQISSSLESYIEVLNNADKQKFLVRNVTKCAELVNILWQTAFDSRVIALRTSDTWTIIVLADKTMHIISSLSGSFVCCPISLPYVPAHMALTSSQFLCVINILGHISVWDLSLQRMIVDDAELRFHLLSENDIHSVVSCDIYPDGTPVLGISNGTTIGFCKTSGWLLLYHASSTMEENYSLLQNIHETLNDTCPLKSVMKRLNWCEKFDAKKFPLENITMESIKSRNLISLLLSAEKLGSPLEYKTIFLELIRCSAGNGNSAHLEALMDYLTLVPNNKILGLKKSELLYEAIKITSDYPQCEDLLKRFLLHEKTD